MMAVDPTQGEETFLQRRLRLKAEREAAAQPRPAIQSRTVTVDTGNHRAQRWAERKLEENCRTLTQEPEGGRNHALNAVAYSLGRLAPKWLTEQQIHDDLLNAAVAAGLTNLEARATIRSGLSKGMLDPRDPPVDDSEWDVFGAVTSHTASPRPASRTDVTLDQPATELGEDDATIPNTWLPVDLTPYLDGSYTSPEPQILTRNDQQSLIYPGRVHWLSGEPESLKSWLALLAVAQIIRTGQRVAYIDLEDGPAGVTARLLAMGLSPEQILAMFDYIGPHEPLNYSRRDELEQRLDGTALVVIDACTESLAMQALSPKDDVDVAKWLEILPRWLTRLGCAVLVLDHVTKDSETRGRWATGSQHKLAGLDGVAFTLEAVEAGGKGMRGRSRLYVSKDRHGQVRPHAIRTSGAKDWIGDLVVDSTTGLFTDVTLTPPLTEQPDFRPTVLMERIAAILEKVGPLSKTQLTERVKGRTVEVKRALACLVDDGFVIVERGERGAELHSLTTPYPPVEEAS